MPSGFLPCPARQLLQSSKKSRQRNTSEHPLRHWVKTAGIPRVTPEDAPQAHPSALCCPVSFHRLICVMRTRRIETTVAPHHRRKRPLIESNQKQQKRAHDPPALVPTPSLARIGARQCGSKKKAIEGSVNLPVCCVANCCTGNHNTIPSRLNLTHAQSYRFTHAPFHPIPLYRFAYATTH